jgi:3-methylfumaryl-CoA hydratase
VDRADDWLTPRAVAAWRATLDRDASAPAAGETAPLGIHWTMAPPIARESELGADGHPRRDERSFLPPIPMPRRMWAGSRIVFHRPLRVGDHVARESTIAAVAAKEGRSSPLVFVTVRHRFTVENELALEEEQDLVYRPEETGRVPARSAIADAEYNADGDAPAWQRSVHPSATLLFRYSALTLNGHRIHYDRRYASETEGYPGLVVHAPLVATLLLDLLQTAVPSARIRRFAFRALRPTFDTSDFTISATPAMDDRHFHLWSTNNAGARAVEADAWTD